MQHPSAGGANFKVQGAASQVLAEVGRSVGVSDPIWPDPLLLPREGRSPVGRSGSKLLENGGKRLKKSSRPARWGQKRVGRSGGFDPKRHFFSPPLTLNLAPP
eukprot:scaffold86249_cov66-Phaeocystis_antarctica.AAC.2